jgi:hypothetical protein
MDCRSHCGARTRVSLDGCPHDEFSTSTAVSDQSDQADVPVIGSCDPIENCHLEKAKLMSHLNPQNERIKRDYLRHQRNALGKSETTLDAMRKALARFEYYTCHRDFKTFRREQAIGFKERLAETYGQRSGERLSRSTQASTLVALKDFFRRLA